MIGWANQCGMARGLFHQQQLIGTALCWHWGDGHANLGLMIIDPAWQKQGLGRRLLTHLLDAHAARTLSLMATEAGLPLYAQLGFEPLGRNTQYQGIFQAHAGDRPLASPPAPARNQPTWPSEATLRFQSNTPRPATLADLDALIALDTRWRGLDRGWLLRELLQPRLPPSPPPSSADLATSPPIHTQATSHPAADPAAGWQGTPFTPPPANACAQSCSEACAVLTGPDGPIRAYGVRRRFGRGWLIGPLLAPHADDAITLLDWLCTPLAGAFVRIDLGWQPPPQTKNTLNTTDTTDTEPHRLTRPESGPPRPPADANALLPTSAQAVHAPQMAHMAQAGQAGKTGHTPLHHWLITHGLSVVDQPLAMQRPPRQGPTSYSPDIGAGNTSPSSPDAPPRPPTSPLTPAFPSAPVIQALISQATG